MTVAAAAEVVAAGNFWVYQFWVTQLDCMGSRTATAAASAAPVDLDPEHANRQ